MSDDTQAARQHPQTDDERRESDRVPIHLLVRDAALGGSFEPYDGNLALGGVFFYAYRPPFGAFFSPL